MMRHLLLFSLVLTLSFSAAMVKESHAEAVKVNIVADTPITEKLDEIWEALKVELQKMGEQGTTVSGAVAKSNLAGQSAATMEGRIGTSMEVQAGIAVDNLGADTMGCDIGSGSQSTALVHEISAQDREQKNKAAMDIINGVGQSENGAIDFKRELYEESKQFTGTDHFNVETLLKAHGFSLSDSRLPAIRYLEKMLFARIPLSLNPDLIENADDNTDIQNILVDHDRLKSELSIGQSAFSIAEGNRRRSTDASVIDPFKEIYQANGWSPQMISAMTADGISVNGLYHALTIASHGAPYMMQQLDPSRPEKQLLSFIGKQLMINNMLQYEQYKFLENIALATATTVTVNRDDAINDLNARISRANSGR